jgi:hypothetical protein
VLNLIVNAIEAMTSTDDDARELVVSTESSPAEGLLVAVDDRGAWRRCGADFRVLCHHEARRSGDWPFDLPAPSSRPMAGDCGPTTMSRMAPSSGSRCRCGSKPTFSKPNDKLKFSACRFSQHQPSSNRNEPRVLL